MAPSTTGIKAVDAARSFELCRAALDLAEKVLVQGGAFACKIFQGEDMQVLKERVRSGFKQQKIFKPQASRKASKEMYIIGLGKVV